MIRHIQHYPAVLQNLAIQYWKPIVGFTVLAAVGLIISSPSDYPAFRDWYNGTLAWPHMPPDVPLVWLGLFAALILALALLHEAAKRRDVMPRISFENLRVDRTLMNGNYETYFGRIDIRNSPYNMENGMGVTKAFAVLGYHNLKTGQKWKCEYGRWLSNPKVRADEQVKFNADIMNRRDLPGNGESTTLDFCLKQDDGVNAFQLRADSQGNYHMMENPEYAIPPGEYRVSLSIQGIGLRRPATHEIVLINKAAGHRLVLESDKRRRRFFLARVM